MDSVTAHCRGQGHDKMPIIKAKLSKLSICECGFPLLNPDIPLGTIYRIDTDVSLGLKFMCGGCHKWKQIVGVYVLKRGESKGGFLPRIAFEPVKQL